LTLPETPHLLRDLPQGSKILILRLRSLGDLVLETPSIAAIHAWRPDLRIDVAAEPRFADIFCGNPAVCRVAQSEDFFPTARSLRRERFAVAFNQHGGPRSALLTGATGATSRVCWKNFQFSFLYNVLVPDTKEFYGTAAVHAVEHRISQFYWTGLPRGPIPRAEVFPQPDAVQSVCRLLSQSGFGRGVPYAVLQPGARLPGMRWPAERFAEVARWLRAEHGIESVVNLASGDQEVALRTHNAMRGLAVVPAPLSVRELIALIGGASIFVGNDSGPVHIAAATQRPCVVIYGQTNPVQWHPWQTEYRALHTDALFDPQRGDKSTPLCETRSISTITVEEVLNACSELLAGRGSANKAGS
jgi:ADP-heptose:LPS heptosyltransferase